MPKPQALLLLVAMASVFSTFWGFRLKARANRRVQRSESWPQFVEAFVSGLTAGLGKFEAMELAVARSPKVLKAAFLEFERNLQTKMLKESLLDLRDSMQDPLVDEFVELLLVNQELGGAGLSFQLKRHAKNARALNAARAQARSKTTATLAMAKLGVAAPWVLLALLLTRSESAGAFDSNAGMTILIAGLAICALAYRFVTIIGRLSTQERVYVER